MKRASVTLLAGAVGALVASQALAQASTPDGDVGQPASPAASAPAGAPASADEVIKEQTKLTEIFKAKEAASKADEAASKAKQAAIEAEKAAKAAKDGAVTGQTAIQGTIQVGEGPKAEALLLASRGAISAAKIIRADLETVFRQDTYKDRPVLIATSSAQLSSVTLTAFDVRRQTLKRQLDGAHARFNELPDKAQLEALIQAPETPREGADRSALAVASAVSQGLDVASKLASYFKADYTFGQLAVKTAPDLYANAIVRSFRDSDVHPRFYATTHMTAGQVAGLVTDLGALQDAYALVARDHAFALKAAADLRAAAAEDKSRAGKLLSEAAGYEAFAAGAGKLLEATDGFLTALFTETADKPAPIVQVAKEREIQRLVAANGLVLLVSGEPAAAYFTKKSLWTSIVGAPLYTMGGANVVYSLYDAATGYVVTDGVVPVHGGYMNVRDVQRMFPAP